MSSVSNPDEIWGQQFLINPSSASAALIQKPVKVNQLTGFYMRATLALNGLSKKNVTSNYYK